ncbi:hypothetical protein [Bifidobacterium aesculapii]|uniref:hypothetical protein n=1 Tax=Bifidobacterium aesculapii TaxID=1329411 RepID=UPI001364A871|nr:hypothetical protein [Bifidobacterium aesculapii]
MGYNAWIDLIHIESQGHTAFSRHIHESIAGKRHIPTILSHMTTAGLGCNAEIRRKTGESQILAGHNAYKRRIHVTDRESVGFDTIITQIRIGAQATTEQLPGPRRVPILSPMRPTYGGVIRRGL